MSNIQALNPNNSSSPQLIKAIASTIDVNEVYGSMNQDEYWNQRYEQLNRELDREINKVELNKHITSLPFEIVDFALDQARNFSPPLISHFAQFTQWKHNKAKEYVLAQMDDSLRRTFERMGHTVLAEFIDSRDGMPYAALFPLNDMELAKRNLQSALDNMSDKLPEETKSVIAKGIAKAALKIVEEGHYLPENRIAEGEISEESQKLKKGTDSLQSMQKEIADETEAVERLAKETMNQLEMLNRGSSAIEVDKLKEFANDVLRFNQISSNVLEAAVNLGLSENTANTLGKLNSLAVGAAQLYIGGFSNPLTAINGGATIVNTLLGGKKDNGLAKMHKQIMKALGAIMRQNAQILENQKRMISALSQIMINQVSITELVSKTSDHVLKNRELILSIITGPISLLETYAEKNPDLFGSLHGGKELLSYSEVKDSIYSDYGDVISRGLYQLELILLADDTYHPILKSKTYLNESEVNISVEDDNVRIRIDQNDLEKTLSDYNKKLQIVKKLALSKRTLTEFASFDLFIGHDKKEGDLLNQNNRNDFLEEMVSDRPSIDNLGDLLDVGMVYKVSKLAYLFHHYFQFTSSVSGLLALKSEEDLREDATPSERGYEILKSVNNLLNTAISQRFLLSNNFERSKFLISLFQGLSPTASQIKSYKSFDKDYKLLSVYLQSITASLDFDIEDLQVWQQGYLEHTREYDELKREVQQQSTYYWDVILGGDERANQLENSMLSDLNYIVSELEFILKRAGIHLKIEVYLKPEYDFRGTKPPGWDDRWDKAFESGLKSFTERDDILDELSVPNRKLEEIFQLDWEYNQEKNRTDFFLVNDWSEMKIKLNKDEDWNFNGINYKNFKPLVSTITYDNSLENYLRKLDNGGDYVQDKGLMNSFIYPDTAVNKFEDEVEILLRMKGLIKNELLPYHLKDSNKTDLKNDWIWSIIHEDSNLHVE